MKLKNMFEDKKTGKILFEAGIIIMIVNLLCAVGIWQSISAGWEVIGDDRLFTQAFIQSNDSYVITYLNQDSIYISFLSVLFSFLGNKEELVSIINLILQLAGVGFFYLGAKTLFGFGLSLIIPVVCGIASGLFYPVVMDSSAHMVWLLSGMLFWIIAKCFRSNLDFYFKPVLLGILLGIFSYVDIAGLALLFVCIFFILFVTEISLKNKSLHLLCLFLCSTVSFFIMFYLWNNLSFNSVVFHQWLNDKLKPFHSVQGVQQYVSIFLILSICVVIYSVEYFKAKSQDAFATEIEPVFNRIAIEEEKAEEKEKENEISK